MSDDLDTTLRAMRFHNWTCVLLQERSKQPVALGGHHAATRDPAGVADHVMSGGNIGVYAGQHTVLDFDVPEAILDITLEVWPVAPPLVITGSGKHHTFYAPTPGVPAAMYHRGKRVGDIIRRPAQYAVAPPSIHPDTGDRYRWLDDPCREHFAMPQELLSYFQQQAGLDGASLPDFVIRDAAESPVTIPHLEEPWTGPPAAEVLRQARARLVGARSYHGGVKGQCPGCAAEGHDRHRDNAYVRADGRWGCAYAPGDRLHRWAIGVWIGALPLRETR